MGVKTQIGSKERIFLGKYGHKESSGEKVTKAMQDERDADAKMKKDRVKETKKAMAPADKAWREKEEKRVKALVAKGMPLWKAQGFKAPQ